MKNDYFEKYSNWGTYNRTRGDIINALMAVASINFKSRLREIKESILLDSIPSSV